MHQYLSASKGTPHGSVSNEDRIVAQRRQRLARSDHDPRVGLALSGGGIRSATFALGVVQAIAEARHQPGQECDTTFPASMLSTFDYLSTVSGGGYLGAFLCSLFLPGRLRPEHDPQRQARQPHDAVEDEVLRNSADDALAVLRGGAPQRMRAETDYRGDHIVRAPLAWLRESGRYLLPTGSGDAFYVMALGLRNWLSLHFVIGTVLIALVSMLMQFRALGAMWLPAFLGWEQELLQAPLSAYAVADSPLTSHIWWSTFSMLWLAPLLTVGLVVGTAFWLVQERPDGRSRTLNGAVVAMVAIGVALLWTARSVWPSHFSDFFSGHWSALRGDAVVRGEVLRMLVVLIIGLFALAACVFYMASASLQGNAAAQRVRLTRYLGNTLVASVAIAGLAVVDTLGQTLYLAATQEHGMATTLSPAALAGALVWLAQQLAKKDVAKWPGLVRRLPLQALAGAAGVLIFILVGALWAMLVHLMIWGGSTPQASQLLQSAQRDILGWTLWAPVAIALITGFFPGFINLSSLQPFYGSRLTRAYLGASNGQRFRDPDLAKRSAAEPMDSDSVRMEDYYANGTIRTLAPLHIINVCVNKTVDPAEQLVQRDRKGQPLAVLPCGIALDTPHVSAFPAPRRSIPGSVDRPLTVGQWIGTSGAAFSTGIGRETSLGMSLLMGAANVRLGTWWPSGQENLRQWPWPTWVTRSLGLLFRTQRYLSYELRASFHGRNRSWQYLSDGGHFENTGLYELLRPQRRVSRIFISDNGADPRYQFDDLANLIRLVRIDLQVEVEVAEPPTTGPLAGLFGRPEDFRPRADPDKGKAVTGDKASTPQGPVQHPVAVLLYATPMPGSAPQASGPVQIVLIKPTVTPDVSADVQQYAATHASFPQEPTADQFFDEAQWESYRALGYQQARKIFTPGVLAALDAHRRARASEKSFNGRHDSPSRRRRHPVVGHLLGLLGLDRA